MSRLVLFAFVIAIVSIGISAQPKALENRFAAENALAEKVLAAHGGEKLRSMKSLVVRGSVDITASNFPQAIAGGFVTIFEGSKYRFELQNPFQNLTQIYDGTNTSSTAPGGMSLPPVNRLGLPLLPFLGRDGFIVTGLPGDKKKKSGFRMTSPEGYFTDFYIDEKTNQIKGYDSTFLLDGRTVTTNVEIDKAKLVDGLLVPERYVQRFDLGQFTVYANFKAKEILVNSQLDAGIFTVNN